MADSWYARVGKRIFDVVGSAALIIVLLPVLAAVWLGVRLQLGNPVLFRQSRVGMDGRPFDVVKFRSMAQDRRSGRDRDSDDDDRDYDGVDRRLIHKSDDDPRHTALGRCIRRWSIDELPQLFNVVKGDMSLVGPRPELVDVAERHGLRDHPRHEVRPGMTGLWQVSSHREGMLYENVDLDLDYVSDLTFLGDVGIMVRTIPAVLRSTGR